MVHTKNVAPSLTMKVRKLKRLQQKLSTFFHTNHFQWKSKPIDENFWYRCHTRAPFVYNMYFSPSGTVSKKHYVMVHPRQKSKILRNTVAATTTILIANLGTKVLWCEKASLQYFRQFGLLSVVSKPCVKSVFSGS